MQMKKTKTSRSRLRLICVNIMINVSSIFTAVNILQFSVENVSKTSIIWMSVLLSISMKLKKWECYRRKTRLQTRLNSQSALMELVIVTSNIQLPYQNWAMNSYSSYFTNVAQQSQRNHCRKNFSKNLPRRWTEYREIRTLKNNLSRDRLT